MIQVSSSAEAQLKTVLQPGSWFRISVVAGGCSGFEKRFDITQTLEQDDIFVGSVVIDPTSVELLGPAVLSYTVTLAEQKFVLDVPGATSSCGCGKSFNI